MSTSTLAHKPLVSGASVETGITHKVNFEFPKEYIGQVQIHAVTSIKAPLTSFRVPEKVRSNGLHAQVVDQGPI